MQGIRKLTWGVFGVAVLSGLLSGCATVVSPLKPGTTPVADTWHGLVFGRIHLVSDRSDQPLHHTSATEFGGEFFNESPGERFEATDITTGGPFVLNLPAGHYRVMELTYVDGLGDEWEGFLPASFTVQPGTMTYLGTWEIQVVAHSSVGKVSARVIDELDQTREELARAYTGSPPPITVTLLKSVQEGYATLVGQSS